MNKPWALCLILFSKRRYEAIGGNNASFHMEVFRTDVRNSLLWICAGTAIAIAALWLRLGADLFSPLNAGKWIALFGIFTGGWATWFALANPEDTWDRDERLDTALRGFFFKVTFFPGLVASIIGTFW